MKNVVVSLKIDRLEMVEHATRKSKRESEINKVKEKEQLP